MTTQTNSRIWQGATLSVRNSGDSAWIDFTNCIDYSFPGNAANKIDASTAASTTDQFRLGLRDNGQAVFNVFDYMDSDFLAEMNTMQDNGDTRKFKLTIIEGTANTRIFTGYVVDQPITGAYNTLWKATLTVKVVNDYWFNAPLTATSMSPTSGSDAGGTTVTITGTGFIAGQTTVIVDGGAGYPATVLSSTSLTFTTPAHASGTAHFTVQTPEKISADIGSGFVYS